MAGIDLGDAWADNVWEEGVWADGVWAGQESSAGDIPGQAGDLTAVSRHVRSFGLVARIVRGLRIIVFLSVGAM